MEGEDSNTQGPGHKKNVSPKVASLWLPLDDVDETNGAMEILPFSAQPESKNRSVPEDFILNSGGCTKGFDNFNLTLNAKKLNVMGKKSVFINRGEAEFHSAWTIHRSDENRSSRRRMVWIVRYCPTGTKVIDGIRGAFTSNYPLIPVMGKGSNDKDFYGKLNSVLDTSYKPSSNHDFYAPCFGNSELLNLLKK